MQCTARVQENIQEYGRSKTKAVVASSRWDPTERLDDEMERKRVVVMSIDGCLLYEPALALF